MDAVSLETAFAFIGCPSPAITERLRTQLQTPPRAYHNESHTVSVVSRVFHLSGGTPSIPLVAAALYHDAVYNPRERDNEERSTDFCHLDLSRSNIATGIIDEARRLILLTTHHRPNADDTDGIILCDADLYILGAPPAEYAAYSHAIRTEYAHVPDSAWQTGRAQVMQRFLERPHIFHGDWEGVASHEAQARRNITTEITALPSCTVDP